jgi:hypothetical protein
VVPTYEVELPSYEECDETGAEVKNNSLAQKNKPEE